MMRQFLNKIPTPALAIAALFLALAPFMQEPHLWEKLKMLFNGSLSKPIDIFDLFMHSTPLTLLIIKIYFTVKDKNDTTVS